MKKTISKEEKLSFLVLKSTILNDLGKHKEALKIVEEVLRESGKIDNTLLHVDALIQKGTASYFMHEDIDGLANCIDKGFEILETTKLDIPEKELAKRKALLIQFNSGDELWIPKSTIHGEYVPKKNKDQKFLIDDWILKKNKIIT